MALDERSQNGSIPNSLRECSWLVDSDIWQTTTFALEHDNHGTGLRLATIRFALMEKRDKRTVLLTFCCM